MRERTDGARQVVTVAQPFIWRLEKTMQLHYLVDMILLGVRHELRS